MSCVKLNCRYPVIRTLWLKDVPVIGQIPTGLPGLQLALPSADFLAHAVEPALILALLGSVDSLLTSLVSRDLLEKSK